MTHLPQTDRLYFREFTMDDAALLYEMHQDPEITRYTGDPLPWTSEEHAAGILREIIIPQYSNKIGRWAVHIKNNDRFIGWCGLKDVDGEVDLGYRYIRAFWGNGYGYEAAKAVLEYGVSAGVHPIVACADAENKASVRILGNIGLTYRETVLEDGRETVKFYWKSPGAAGML
jgi:ribosomal-protein-alanine N-acetyltransferase